MIQYSSHRNLVFRENFLRIDDNILDKNAFDECPFRGCDGIRICRKYGDILSFAQMRIQPFASGDRGIRWEAKSEK